MPAATRLVSQARRAVSTTIVLITARHPGRYLTALRRMKSLGYGVELVMLGPNAADNAKAVRPARLRAMIATVEPGWEKPDAVALVG